MSKINKAEINKAISEIDGRKEHHISVDIAVTVPDNVTVDQFTDELIIWMDSKGYYFGGGIGPYNNGELSDADYKDNYHKD
jgi:hypothetical protein